MFDHKWIGCLTACLLVACGSAPLPTKPSPASTTLPSTNTATTASPSPKPEIVTITDEPPLLKRDVLSRDDKSADWLAQGLISTITPDLFSRQVFARSFNRDQTRHIEMTFKLSEDDIEFRIFLLTLETGIGQSPAIHGGSIRLNGQPLLQPEHFADGLRYPQSLPHYTDDKPRPKITFSPQQLKAGINTLSIDLGDKSGSALSLRLNGIARSEKIIRAFHAKIPHDPSQKDLPYIKGLMSVKFIESLKIRLHTNAAGQQELFDETGIDLSLLNDWLRQNSNQEMRRKFREYSVEEAEQFEVEFEKKSQKEQTNYNLWYEFFNMDENKDMWPFIEEFRKFPFVEEAYPIFLG